MSMNTFVSYTNALELLRALRPVVERLKRFDADARLEVRRRATRLLARAHEGCARERQLAHVAGVRAGP